VVVQLFFFLHLGSETKPRWKLLTLFLMLIFAMIVLLGSIWIMYNLNYRMMRMSPQQINSYMTDQASSGY
jgi:cytochrome o ubiquinol oxidase operon protein cyoD